jgi:hypothetical protein
MLLGLLARSQYDSTLWLAGLEDDPGQPLLTRLLAALGTSRATVRGALEQLMGGGSAS